MISGEKLFLHLMAMFLSSLEKYLSSSAHFKNWLVCLIFYYYWVFKNSLRILHINLLSVMWFANSFFLFCILPPNFVDCFFDYAELLSLIQFHLFIFFMCWFWCHNQKIFARAILRRFLPMFYIGVSHFHVLRLSLQSISIWNFSVLWDRSLISFFCCGYQFFLSPFFEEILHSSWNILALLSNTDWRHIQGFNPGISVLFHWSRYAFLCQYHSFFLLL